MEPTTRRGRGETLGRCLLGTAAAAPFLLSLGFSWIDRAANPAVPAPPKPSLAFEHYLLDRGLLPPGPLARGQFHFLNTGTQPVTITKLEPSCGCMQPLIADGRTTYQPGQAGSFEVRIRTANESPGPQQYFVKVHYTDPEPHQVEVSLKAIFPHHQVRVDPPALMVYQSDESQPHVHEIVVSDYRARPMRLTDVHVARSSAITATLGAADDSRPGERHTRVRVTIAGKLPARRHESTVVIGTDDPSYPEVVVPIFVERLDTPALSE